MAQGSMTMTVEETAKYLKISRGLAYQACRTGRIPCLRLGRRILVSRRALDKLLEQAGSGQESGGSKIITTMNSAAVAKREV